jgi:phage shock protein C
MFCTRCGNDLREQDRFCSQCGAPTPKAETNWSAPGFTPSQPRSSAPLSRPMSQAKIAGVCAGFARHFGIDVTLVRVLWIVLTVFPMPFFGLIAYIVAWIVMPKDQVLALQAHVADRPVV